MAKQGYFGRRYFSGWQKNILLVAAATADGKITFFWCPLF